MRWLADECVHAEVVDELRAAGHDVTYAAEFARQTPDPVLLQAALAGRRIFLTEDKGIGELVFEQETTSFGVVLMRFATADRHLKWPQLNSAITEYGEELYLRYTVLTKSRTRSQLLTNPQGK